MADPVSLTLGLAPIVGAMFKSYQIVYRKMKVFGRADREVDRLRKGLGRQRQVFVNEMHLLLRLIVDDEEEIEAMVSDADHERWASPDLSQLLQLRLARSYESFQEIVEDIGTSMEYLLKELKRFEGLDQSTEEESSKVMERVQRLRSAAKLTFDKSKCDKAVQDLRTANDDLKRLREQAHDLQPTKQSPNTDRRSEVGPKLRSSYTCCAKIRRATRALHEGLSKTLPSHHHDVRLFLEATVVEDNTIIDLAILCASQDAVSRSIVQVRSRPIDWLEMPSQTPSSLIAAIETPQKRRRVRWSDQQAEPHTHEPFDPRGADPETEEKLRLAQDLCLEICRGKGCHDERRTKDCLCYFETTLDQTFRHEFYPRGGQIHRPTELATFDEILLHPVETSISMVDQLKLARTIVSAVLYFSSTPWLAEYWGLKDLCFFLDRNDLPTSLRTLNLGVKFLGSCAAQLEGAMEGVDSASASQESPPAIDEAMLVYGVRNMTLHSLGVVLLQIGMWNRVEPDDVLQVRRLARQVPRLGPKYRDLMQKCLNCDFGCGSNLTRPQLQQAVYEDIVEELDAMIKCLDISSDDGAP
ncbi:hypothetical protein CONLIGDRAFT_632836 [Coniochaeta ligniaria NRRL 30616]|uniref:DUF7580 domain-containing protein n=1 Tax=Coniochaeta ligniaria NRRL 30616 TaxID=1408157 RepID=A0A1J7J5I7_9PEZI|nr:hypothetical protein CONLIGDRAFT_632836 [Coniochaeta ligniaria NRRL 30616]